MFHLCENCRLAFRLLFLRPGSAMLAVLALTLGTGLSTSMFTVLNGSLFKTPDIPRMHEVRRLTRVYEQDKGPGNSYFPLAEYEFMAREQTAFASLTGYYQGTVNLSGAGHPIRIIGAYVTPSFFEVYEIPVQPGQSFQDRPSSAESAPGSAPEAREPIIISHRLWQNHFHLDPQIVGRTIKINGRENEIIGVAARDFHYPGAIDAWLLVNQNTPNWLVVEGRLHDRGSQEEALPALLASLQKQFPAAYNHQGVRLHTTDLMQIAESPGPWLWTLMAAVTIVLLIACANVANLLLSRASFRTRELAIRAALGATRRQLIGQLLCESLLLAIIGMVGGVILSLWLVDIMWKYAEAFEKPLWITFDFDWRVWLFVGGTVLLTTVLAGIIPAWQASKIDINTALKSGNRTVTDWRTSRFSRIIVITQIAFSFVLAIGAGLTIRTLLKVEKMDPGFDPRQYLTMRLGLFPEKYPTIESRQKFWNELIASVDNLPGIDQAAASTWLALFGGDIAKYKYTDEDDEETRKGEARIETVTASYFPTMGMELLAGRGFGPEDTVSSPPVCIVNTALLEQMDWTPEEAPGRSIHLIDDKKDYPGGDTVLQIAGVVTSINPHGVSKADPRGYPVSIYKSMHQSLDQFGTLIVKMENADPLAMEGLINKQILRLDPDLPAYFVMTFDDYFQRSAMPYRIMASTLYLYGAVSLFLCAIGIYGVISFSVNRRRKEFGIRMALGAQRTSIAQLVLWQSLWQLLIGLLTGLFVAFFTSQALSGFLFGVKPMDVATYVSGTIILTLVAILSCLVPMFRALRYHPLETLQTE